MTQFISEKDAAALLHKSESWLRALRYQGNGPKVATKVGRTPLYLAEDVLAWALEQGNSSDDSTEADQ